jgi:hypothetical protein
MPVTFTPFLWTMAKDRRYTTVKNLITGGYIKFFREIFDTLPKSVVARDLGMNNIRFSKLMNNMDLFLLRDLFRFASFLEIEETVLLNLVYQQYLADKKSKKKKS